MTLHTPLPHQAAPVTGATLSTSLRVVPVREEAAR